VRAAGKTVRVASKSVRSVPLLRRIVARGGRAIRGIMAFSPEEAHFLVERGFDDILVAYPTAQPADAALVAQANQAGARVALAVDDMCQVDVAERAGREAGVVIPLVVDVDVGYRPVGDCLHVGVRRSPLRTPSEVADFAVRIGARASV